MFQQLLHWRLFKVIAIAVIVAFLSMIPAETGFAQLIMPPASQLIYSTAPTTPTLLTGIRVNPKDPFNLDFIISNSKNSVTGVEKKDEYNKLIRYFMASLVIPNTDMWVNLSPDEADRIIPEKFSLTEMGRDMLAQDYLLKQFTSSLMHPDGAIGREFWQQIYRKVYELYGTTDIPVDTFNKVWISADKADIYQKNDTALLVSSHLKVQVERDFMNQESNRSQFAQLAQQQDADMSSHKMVADIVREVIIPVIEKEVNEGANFATVRQVYNSMILATWFKKTLKDSLLGQVYVDQGKTSGIDLSDPREKDRIYQEYLEAYRDGVFNYIKEEYDELSRELLPRKYFAGGMSAVLPATLSYITFSQATQQMGRDPAQSFSVASVALERPDGAMFGVGDHAQGIARSTTWKRYAGVALVLLSLAGTSALAADKQAPDTFAKPVAVEQQGQLLDRWTGKEISQKLDLNDFIQISAEMLAGNKIKLGKEDYIRLQAGKMYVKLVKVSDLPHALPAGVYPRKASDGSREVVSQIFISSAATVPTIDTSLVAAPKVVSPTAPVAWTGTNNGLDVGAGWAKALSTNNSDTGKPALDVQGSAVGKDVRYFEKVAGSPEANTVTQVPNAVAGKSPLLAKMASNNGTTELSTGSGGGPDDDPADLLKKKYMQSLRQKQAATRQYIAGIHESIAKQQAVARVNISQQVQLQQDINDDADKKALLLEEQVQKRIDTGEYIKEHKIQLPPEGETIILQLPNTSLTQRPVAFSADRTAQAIAGDQIAQMEKIVNIAEEQNWPFLAVLNHSYNQTLGTMPVVLNNGFSLGFGVKVPFGPIYNIVMFPSSELYANYSQSLLTNQILGPVYLADALSQLYNYAITHKMKGKDRIYDLNQNFISGLFQTLTVHVVPVESVDQEGKHVQEYLLSPGISDTIGAGLGKLSSLVRDSKGVISENRSGFILQDLGFVAEAGKDNKNFALFSAMNKDPNNVCVKTYQVEEDGVRFYKTEDNTIEQVPEGMQIDKGRIFYKAWVQGSILSFDPQNKEVSGNLIPLGPTFVSTPFLKTMQSNGNQVYQDIQPSLSALEKEQQLNQGYVQEPGSKVRKPIYAALRHPFSKQIVRFVLDPQELNRLIDAPDIALKFKPGKGMSQSSSVFKNAVNIAVDYTSDQITTFYDKWAALVKTPVTPGLEKRSASDFPEMAAIPNPLRQFFEQGGVVINDLGTTILSGTKKSESKLVAIGKEVYALDYMTPANKALAEAADEQLGSIIFNLPGTPPAVVTDMTGLTEVGYALKDYGPASGASIDEKGQYKIAGFAGDGFPANLMVMVADGKITDIQGRIIPKGKIIGHFQPNNTARSFMIRDSQETNKKIAERNAALSEYGQVFDMQKGGSWGLKTTPYGVYQRAADAGVTGKKIQDPNNGGKWLTLTSEMLVRVDKNKNVLELLEPGLRAAQDMDTIYGTLLKDGFEVFDESGKIVVVAKGNALTEKQLATGIIKPESWIIPYFEANRIKMVPSKDNLTLDVMTITKNAQVRREGVSVAKGAKTLDEFKKINVRVEEEIVLDAPEGGLQKTQIISYFASRAIFSDQKAVELEPSPRFKREEAKAKLLENMLFPTVLGPSGEPLRGITVDAQVFDESDFGDVANFNSLRFYLPPDIQFLDKLAHNTPIRTVFIPIPYNNYAYTGNQLSKYYGGEVPAWDKRISIQSDNYIAYLQQVQALSESLKKEGINIKFVPLLLNEPEMPNGYAAWTKQAPGPKVTQELFRLIDDVAGKINKAFGNLFEVGTVLGNSPEAFVHAFRLKNIKNIGVNCFNPEGLLANLRKAVSQAGDVTPKQVFISEMGSHSAIPKGSMDGEAVQKDIVEQHMNAVEDGLKMSWHLMTLEDNKLKDTGANEVSWGLKGKKAFQSVQDFLRKPFWKPEVTAEMFKQSIQKVKGFASEETALTGEIPPDAKLFVVDNNGQEGRLVKVHGKGYVFWALKDVEKNLSSYYVINYLNGNSEFATIEQIRADLYNITKQALRISIVQKRDSLKYLASELLDPLFVKLGRPIGEFKSKADAVDWLNASTLPFKHLQNNSRVNIEIKKLLPDNFDRFSALQLEEFARTVKGQQIKRLSLIDQYPADAPSMDAMEPYKTLYFIPTNEELSADPQVAAQQTQVAIDNMEIGVKVSETEMWISKFTEPDKYIAKAFVRNSFVSGINTITIIERRGYENNAPNAIFGVVTQTTKRDLTIMDMSLFGSMQAQLFPVTYKDGHPETLKMMLGPIEQEIRPVYMANMVKTDRGDIEYQVDWTKTVGTAIRSQDLVFSKDTLSALELTDRKIVLAEERDKDNKFLKGYIIDTQTNQEIGVLNTVKYHDDGKEHLEVSLNFKVPKEKNADGLELKSFLMTVEHSVVKGQDGKELPQRVLSINTNLSSAVNATPISLQEMEDLVKPLAGKLRTTVAGIAAEIGIPLDKVRIIPSHRTNHNAPNNIMYRVEGDPFPNRAVVLQSVENVEQASFLINTVIEGKIVLEAYELTPTLENGKREINLVKTTETNLSKEEFLAKLKLNNVAEMEQNRANLSFDVFDNFIEITTLRCVDGVDGKIKDPILVRYISGEDVFGLILAKVENQLTNVRFINYSLNNLAGRSPIISSGETAFIVGDNAPYITRVTEYSVPAVQEKDGQKKGAEASPHTYSYHSVYERSALGVVDYGPNIKIDYFYDTGVVRQWFQDSGSVFYSWEYMPFLTTTTNARFQDVGRYFKTPENPSERVRSTFETRVMEKDGLTFRLIMEKDIPGASHKSDLRDTLFINGKPVAVKMGTDIQTSVVEQSRSANTLPNGMLGVAARALGLDGGLGVSMDFSVPSPLNDGTKFNVKNIMDEMRVAQPGSGVYVMNLDSAVGDKLLAKPASEAKYTNWLFDRVLKWWTLLAPILGVLAMPFTLWGWKRWNAWRAAPSMNSPRLANLQKLSGKKDKNGAPKMLPGLADKWRVFIALHKAVMAKDYKEKDVPGSENETAGSRLRKSLGGTGNFFSEGEVDNLVALFESGDISFSDVSDPERDGVKLPKFTIEAITGPDDTDALPLVALRYVAQKQWLSNAELQDIWEAVKKDTPVRRELELNWQWDELLGRVRLELFRRALTGQLTLEQTLPCPEVGLYKTLLNKGYHDNTDKDIVAYVNNPVNGGSELQRVEAYVSQVILKPMVTDTWSDLPRLGDSMGALRKKPVTDAVISEFYRFAALNPDILPAKSDFKNGKVSNEFLDKPYNPNIMFKYSEAATFREKIISHLLYMPPSDTDGLSFGAIGSLAPMLLFFTRRLIRQFQKVEQNVSLSEPAKSAEKIKIIDELQYHVRFWTASFETNNWSNLFGKGMDYGFYKKITDAGRNNPSAQPNLFLKEFMYDEHQYSFFERVQKEEDLSHNSAVYDQLVAQLLNNEKLLRERLQKAKELLENKDGVILKKANDINDEDQKKDRYKAKIAGWLAEIKSLEGVKTWTEEQKKLALALAGESLLWEIVNIKDNAADNDKLTALAHGPYTQIMDPFIKKTSQYRLERNSYVYFVNELTSTFKGGLHIWLLRRLAPKFAMGPVSWWFSKTLGTMKFKVREFNETVTAQALLFAITKDEKDKTITDKKAVNQLNKKLLDPQLYLDLRTVSPANVAAQKWEAELQLTLNESQLIRANRRLIEAALPVQAPVSLEFTNKEGQRTYRLQNSLEDYFGIQSKWQRYAIVAAKTAALVFAGFPAVNVTMGLGIIALIFTWGALPLLAGKATYGGKERSFRLSVLALGSAFTVLFAELLFGTAKSLIWTTIGTFITGGLYWILIPLTMMFGYFITIFVKTYFTYGSEVWNKYWVFRTVGIGSLGWLTIQNVSFLKRNFFGEFYGKMIGRLITVQRERGYLLPTGWLLQDNLIADFKDLQFQHSALSPNERRSWEASVEFISLYDAKNTAQPGSDRFKALLATAKKYEETLKAQAELDGKIPELAPADISEEALVALKRPFTLMAPKEVAAREYMFNKIQAIVFKKPLEDVFARIQGVTTHVQSHNEAVTNTMEKIARLGTFNIFGAREFRDALAKDFRQEMKDDHISWLRREQILDLFYSAFALKQYPITIATIKNNLNWGVITKDSFNDKTKFGFDGPKIFKWLDDNGYLGDASRGKNNEGNKYFIEKDQWEDAIKSKFEKALGEKIINLLKNAAKNWNDLSKWREFLLTRVEEAEVKGKGKDIIKNGGMKETSLLGHCLYYYVDMRNNMIASLKDAHPQYTAEFQELKVVLDKVMVTDNVLALYKEWASKEGRSHEAVILAREALMAFADEILPNNISMLKDVGRDMLSAHLSAAKAYSNDKYHRLAIAMHSKYGSLLLAFKAEDPNDADLAAFKKDYEFYQRSAELKVSGMLQYQMIWTSPNEFRFADRYEKQDYFDTKDVTVANYKYLSRGALRILNSGVVKFDGKQFNDLESVEVAWKTVPATARNLIEKVGTDSTIDSTIDKLNKLLNTNNLGKALGINVTAPDYLARIKAMTGKDKESDLKGAVLARWNRILLDEVLTEYLKRDVASVLRNKFWQKMVEVSRDPQSGIKYVMTNKDVNNIDPLTGQTTTTKAGREVVFCNEFYDLAKVFLEFYNANILDIWAISNWGEAMLWNDMYEMMKYVNDSVNAGAIIPFYDVVIDHKVAQFKNGGIGLNGHMNMGRALNMDAGVRSYPGQNLFNWLYASMVGRNPEIVITNFAFKIDPGTNRLAFAVAKLYAIGQETFTRFAAIIPSFFGKGGVFQPAANCINATPVEDSENFYMAQNEYPYQRSIVAWWLLKRWPRFYMLAEATSPTEGRYVSNVMRLLMDPTSFELVVNKLVGFDIKMAYDQLYNHYMYAHFVALLSVLMPVGQGFSGFAYLAPVVVFIPIAFLFKQAINSLNYFRQWVEHGNLWYGIVAAAVDTFKAFPFYNSQPISWVKKQMTTGGEYFRFDATIKDPLLGFLDRTKRFADSHLISVTNVNEAKIARMKLVGLIGMVSGVILWGLTNYAVWPVVISPNLWWAGVALALTGLLSYFLGFVIDYKMVKVNGIKDKPIPIPFDAFILVLANASYFMGAVFTTFYGPIVTFPYLLSCWAGLAGFNVFDAWSNTEKDKQGNDVNYFKGVSGTAMFSNSRAMFWTFFWSGVAAIAFSFVPVSLFAMVPWLRVGMNWLLYGIMFATTIGGAFSSITEKHKMAGAAIWNYGNNVIKEVKNRQAAKVKEAASQKNSAQDAAQVVEPLERVKAESLDAAQVFEPLKRIEVDPADAAQFYDDFFDDDVIGGISMNSANLTINIKVDGGGMPLAIQFQSPEMVNIQGLAPYIRSIAPVTQSNAPVLYELMQAVR